MQVNGTPIRDPGFAVTGDEEVTYAGKPVAYHHYEYYMMNKPAGVITATEDRRKETVLDLMKDVANYVPTSEQEVFLMRKDLSPVGRLDRDTVGLLLITNDGALNHRLLSPKKHVDKQYFARVKGKNGVVTESDVQAFADGLPVDEELTALPAKLEITGTDENSAESETLVTIREGKFHQIKRMFAARDQEVIYLKRLSMGPLTLDPDLPEGKFRKLTDEELAALMTASDSEG